MNLKLFSILFPFGIFFLVGCKKVPKGTEISISGKVKTENVNGAIPNGTVLIIEYKSGMYGLIPLAIIDSTMTDENGDYSITAKATGNGIGYKAKFRPPDGYISNPDIAVSLDVSKPNVANFDGTKLSVLKANYSVLNNNHPPLSINIGYYYFGRYIYYINNSDTTIYMYVVPNSTNKIDYSIRTNDTPSVNRWSYGSIKIGDIQDTPEINIKIDVDTFR